MIKVITLVQYIILLTYLRKVKNTLLKAAWRWTVTERGRCSRGRCGRGRRGKAAGRSEEQLETGGGWPRPSPLGTHTLT